MKEKILVVGNGNIGRDYSTGKSYINNRTGNFLLDLKKQSLEILYIEPLAVFDFHKNLQNFCLEDNNISFVALKNKKGFSTISLIFRIARLIKKQDFIYIFIPGTLGKLIGLISIFLSKPFGIYLRGEANLSFVNKLIIKRSSFILAVSPNLKDRMMPLQKRVECIRPMIDISIQDIQRKTYQYNQDLRVLYVGNISTGKGIAELIAVAQKFCENKISATFRIVGGGHLLKELSEKKDLKNVSFTGQIAEKNKLLEEYKIADIFYFPSHTEGFPRVLFEAMSQSLPIFTTMVGGISGYMRAGENCIAIPEKDARAQFNILTNNLKNEAFLNKIASNGCDSVTEILMNTIRHDELFIKYLNQADIKILK